MQAKNTIRKEMLALREQVDSCYVSNFSAEAKLRLVTLPVFQKALSVMLYMDFKKEAPTQALIEATLTAGKTLILPYTDESFEIQPYEIAINEKATGFQTSQSGSPFENDNFYRLLEKSRLGIWEPNQRLNRAADLKSIDLVIVPGVAFDLSGNRLGYGRGCYDRFLPKLRADVPKLALAYDFQILESLPYEPTDVLLDGFV